MPGKLIHAIRSRRGAWSDLETCAPKRPRSMLLRMQAFDSLQSAYDDFDAYTKQEKLPHSQRRFTHRMLYKKVHGAYLASKGWNARILCEWLRDAVNRVALNQPTEAPRKLKMVPAVDQCLRDTCIAMRPVPNLENVCVFFGSTSNDRGNVQSSSNFKRTRTALCRYFNLSERAARYLSLGQPRVHGPKHARLQVVCTSYYS